MDHDRNRILLDFLRSDIAQIAVRRGYHHDLIRYVVTQHFMKTGQQFSTPDELLESLCEAQCQGVVPTWSEVEAMDVDSDSTSTISSNNVDILPGKLAGLSIHDEPSKKMNPPSSTVPQTFFIVDFLQSGMAQMAFEMGFNLDLIRYVVTQHFMKTGRQFSTPDELLESLLEAQCQASSKDIKESNLIQMAVEMGFPRDLINVVLNQNFRKKGQPLSTFIELIDSILEVQGQSVDPSLSGLQAMGGQDVPSTSAMSSSTEDTSMNHLIPMAGKLAGRHIHDEPRKKMSPPSRRVPPDTPIGSLRPHITVSSGSSDPSKHLCKICYDNELSIVFLPCKHLATCSDCAAKVTVCPLCRQPIVDSLTIVMP